MSERQRAKGATTGAVVLAAGSSERMQGANKLLARLDGVPLVCRTVAAVRAASLAPVVVVLGHDAGRVADALAACDAARDVELVVNAAHARGQQGSVTAGLAAVSARADAVMIVPADMPLLAASDLRALLDAFGARRPECEALVPFTDGARGNPVVVAARAVEAVLAAPEGGMRRYIDAHPGRVQRFESHSDHYIVDADTREALQQVARRMGMRLDW
ncbi:MAG TPA: nucleotidyltransferase family protein [Burkholderiaceae bacterium]